MNFSISWRSTKISGWTQPWCLRIIFLNNLLEKSLGFDTTAALALLSPLAALGLIERKGDLWKNSTVANKNLVKGKPSYMGTYITKILYEGQQFPKMGALLDVLKTGKALQRDIYGEDWKSQAKTLIRGQHEASLSTANYLMKKKKLDLSGAKAFLDLGCGSGAYSIAACQTYPQLKACCVDFKEILEVTEKYIAASGLSEKGHRVQGDSIWQHWRPGANNHGVIDCRSVQYRAVREPPFWQVLKRT